LTLAGIPFHLFSSLLFSLSSLTYPSDAKRPTGGHHRAGVKVCCLRVSCCCSLLRGDDVRLVWNVIWCLVLLSPDADTTHPGASPGPGSTSAVYVWVVVVVCCAVTTCVWCGTSSGASSCCLLTLPNDTPGDITGPGSKCAVYVCLVVVVCCAVTTCVWCGTSSGASSCCLLTPTRHTGGHHRGRGRRLLSTCGLLL